MNEMIHPPGESRRGFLGKLTGWLFGLGVAGGSWTFLRSLVPNVLYEPPKRFKIGRADDYQEGVRFLDEHRIYLFRNGNAFHAISGVCTHLGCTVKFSPFTQERELTVRKLSYRSQGEFHCACHGSRFRDEGTNFAGPAPRPLRWHRLELSPEDGQLVVDLAAEVDRDFRLVVST
ncbi:MAG: ubiquinol-cytochrome c reductase iron-sulfur subunit [bacterium]|nr:ubiquinol-cytochrome c reductase iron-sulfur subunit [bacterium]